MAMKYLGETLDIHTGGIDLHFRITKTKSRQSEGAPASLFARYWLHAEHFLSKARNVQVAGGISSRCVIICKGYKPSLSVCSC